MHPKIGPKYDYVYLVGFVAEDYPVCGICGKPFTPEEPASIRSSAVLSIPLEEAILTDPNEVRPGYLGLVTEKGNSWALNIKKDPHLMVHDNCDDQLETNPQNYLADLKRYSRN